MLAIVYTDLFRGVPTILVIFMLGFGMPALRSSGCRLASSSGPIVALVLVYTAYVAEVYRAGIESVHPSQDAAARSLGLTAAPGAPLRDPPPGGAPCRAAAAQRLHRAAEGHRTRRHCSGRSRRSSRPRSTRPRRSTARRTSSPPTLFVALTIPLARFTDWLVARDRRRQLAGLHDGAARGPAARRPAQVLRQDRGAAGDRPDASPSTRSSA